MCVHGLRESVVMVLNVCLHSCRNMACVHVVCNQTVVQYSVGLQRNTSCNPAQTMMCVASVSSCSNLLKNKNCAVMLFMMLSLLSLCDYLH